MGPPQLVASFVVLKGDVRFWHIADVPLALTNVCFEGKNRHDAGVTPFPLMTQSGPQGSSDHNNAPTVTPIKAVAPQPAQASVGRA
jgi:hypothetical protein